MKRTSTFVSFLLLSCSFLQLTQSFTQMKRTSTNDLVDDVCKKTPNYNACRRTVDSNPQFVKNDTKDILFIILDRIIKSGTSMLNYISILANQTKDIELQLKYSNCANTYLSLVQHFIPSVIDFTKQKRYGSAIDRLIFDKKQIGRCTKQFNNSTLPLIVRNKRVQRWIDIAIAIVKQM